MIRVLIVEDEDMIRRGLIYTFNWLEMGCVIVADGANGLDGLEKIQKFTPDLVIADIKMPKMSGLEMVEKAQSQGYVFETIILTSYSDFDYAKTAIKLKVEDYILKPVNEDKLKAVIEKISCKVEEKNRTEQVAKVVTNAIQILNLEGIELNSIQSNYVSKALAIIKEHYAEKISIEKIADELEVSASYLSREFKRYTSNTFLEFLNKFRIQRAVELLSGGQLKVYEVGEKVGFFDYKHFYDIFKKYAGMSPSGYINNDK
ncbi:MAG: response regulator [Clostridia bacterium]